MNPTAASAATIRPTGGWIVVALLLAFFGPYFPGTPLRLDQLLGWAHIVVFLALALVGALPAHSRRQGTVVWWAMAIMAFALLRLFADPQNPRAAFQIGNQFSYFAAGAAIFVLHQQTLVADRRLVLRALFAMALALNALALLQFLSPENGFVSAALDLYGGVGGEDEYGDYVTMSALSVLGAGQATSIFGGAHGLAIFNLLVIALGTGAERDRALARGDKALALAALLAALTGGVIAGSKTFLFGLLILLALLGAGGVFALRARALLSAAVVVGVFGALYAYFANELRVTGDVWNLLVEFRWLDALSSRFDASEGYLVDVIGKTFEPFTLLLGLGSSAVDYKYSDFQFRQIVLVAGVPMFVLYYGLLVHLLRLNWAVRKSSPYGWPMFALGVAFIVSGIGMDTHLQARTMPLWIIANLLLAAPQARLRGRTLPAPALPRTAAAAR